MLFLVCPLLRTQTRIQCLVNEVVGDDGAQLEEWVSSQRYLAVGKNLLGELGGVGREEGGGRVKLGGDGMP